MATYLVFPDYEEQGVPKFFSNLKQAKEYAAGLSRSRNLNVRIWKENLRTGLMQQIVTVRPAYLKKQLNPISKAISIPAKQVLYNPATKSVSFVASRGTAKRLASRGIRVNLVTKNPLAAYEVIVQNIGAVYRGPNGSYARKIFNIYVSASKRGAGRAAGESVDLYKDGDVIKSYEGTVR